ncbi:oxaloacetate decarboxylase subunit gamma [Candidatus Methylospira mobilis]|uniref:Probable oxaloacetate decarboxylase gamma chain n=1 Tax=Candidatus Methylospira mobilis TaxID=1808979 RepID=A0A5Q0BNR4_9GAMM|nr:OadG family protein [Candidatus Methylospira mobilis]QFY43891.1 oxaloacetate decarboxylase subunit gamma [Candidatus Methylospira mobilis]WNV04895.1 OadG family protein [Candidatus Methylospira mobilis]
MEPSLGELIQQGLKLMLIGMGIVYLFLMLLVWVINVSSRIISRFDPEPLPLHEHSALPESAVSDDEASDAMELVAVISAALHRYRNQ